MEEEIEDRAGKPNTQRKNGEKLDVEWKAHLSSGGSCRSSSRSSSNNVCGVFDGGGGDSWGCGRRSSGSSSRCCGGSCGDRSGGRGLIGGCLGFVLVGWTITRDVAGLRTLVAHLSSRAQGTSVRCSAVAGNMALEVIRMPLFAKSDDDSNSPTCRMRSTSRLEPGNHGQSGWDLRTCSK